MSTEYRHGPDFLVIGAQKSGTTTLWEDLRAHPDVAMAEKESDGLLDPDVLAAAGQDRYARLFPRGPGLRGEVCTNYSTLPYHHEAARRAFELNPNARIIYIVREPLSRVISHHHHDYGLGLCGPNINVEIQRHPSLLDNTRYGTQLAPWVGLFGTKNTLVIRLEDYSSDRSATLAGVQTFIGLDKSPARDTEIHNSSTNKVIAKGVWARVSRNPIYRSIARPLIPEQLRRRLLSSLLTPAPPRPDPPSREALEHLAAELKPEVALLSKLTGTPPLWDLDEELATQARAQ